MRSTILSNTVPSDTVPSDTVPSDTVPSDTVPSGTVRSGTVPSHTVRSDTPPATRPSVLPAAPRFPLSFSERFRGAGHNTERGAATAEYVIATMAAVGFAGLLVIIMRGDEVRGMLTELVRNALTVVS
jgi:hypothetical protein